MAYRLCAKLWRTHPYEGGKKLPCLEISDAPVFAYRGVVEGFYGTPWSTRCAPFID